MKSFQIASFMGLVFILGACSHSAQEVRTEAKQEPVSNSPGSLKDRMIDLIQQEKNITENQRASLLELAERVQKKQTENQILMNQSKSLLLREILSPNYDVKKANAIAKNIRNLYDKQLHVTIDAMQEAKTILNKLQNRELLLNRMMETGGKW